MTPPFDYDEYRETHRHNMELLRVAGDKVVAIIQAYKNKTKTSERAAALYVQAKFWDFSKVGMVVSAHTGTWYDVTVLREWTPHYVKWADELASEFEKLEG